MLDPAINRLKSMKRILHIHFVRIIILKHVMSKIVWKLHAQHIIFKRNKVHVDLRYPILIEKIVFVEELITLDSSSWNEEDVNLLVVLLLPVIPLVDDLLNNINVWSHSKDDRLILWLNRELVLKYHLLFDFTGFRQLTNDER